MADSTLNAQVSKSGLWAGRIISALVVLFLLFDSIIKILTLPAAVEGTVQAGYPANTVRPIGILLFACILLYVIPRTAILGAVLLTGYLGGATATMVRLSKSVVHFPGCGWCTGMARDFSAGCEAARALSFAQFSSLRA